MPEEPAQEAQQVANPDATDSEIPSSTAMEAEPFELTWAQIRKFRRDGHAVLRQLVDPAVMAQARSPLLQAAAAQGQSITARFGQQDTGPSSTYKARVETWLKEQQPEANGDEKPFVRVHNIWEQGGAAKEFVLSPAIAKVAADLLGVSGVRLYQDSVFIKEPGDSVSPWHRDQAVVPLDTDKFVTIWIPLDKAVPESGTLFFASGSQHNATAMVPDEEIWSNFDVARPECLELGDATAHLGWTLHAAGPNRTSDARIAIQLVFFADGTRLCEDCDLKYGDDVLTLMRWINAENWGPRQLVANAWCPRVWPPADSARV